MLSVYQRPVEFTQHLSGYEAERAVLQAKLDRTRRMYRLRRFARRRAFLRKIGLMRR